jgi:hypothetical protein
MSREHYPVRQWHHKTYNPVMPLTSPGAVLSVSLALAASIGIVITNAQTPATPPVAHFHHVHINATNP